MAEIEIAILERNALSRRLESEEALRRQVSAVETERNRQKRGITWQFTTRDARRKLERLYPVKDPSSDSPPVAETRCEGVIMTKPLEASVG